jgi:hypothetical protein
VTVENAHANGVADSKRDPVRPIFGQRLLGATLTILGVLIALNRDFSPSWELVPQDLPGRQVLALIIGTLFCLGGLGLQANKTARSAGFLLAGLLLLGIFSFSPRILERRVEYMPWLKLAEQAMLVMAVGIVAAIYSPRWREVRERRLRLLCIGFGICELPIGLSHLVALDGVAQAVPAWLPPGQVEWAVLTAICHFAAAIALISGERALPAVRALVVMFAGITVLVWIPRTLAAPDNWQINAVHVLSWALTAAVWILAETLAAQRVFQPAGASGGSHQTILNPVEAREAGAGQIS